MNDLKSSLGVEMNNVTKNAEKSSSLLTEMNDTQNNMQRKFVTLVNKTIVLESEVSKQKVDIDKVDDKIVTLEDKTNTFEDELLEQKHNVEHINRSFSEMVSNVEHLPSRNCKVKH